MSVTAILNSHILVVILFLILFIIKAFLLFTNKTGALESLKRKTKVPDMILGTLILVSGGFLLFQYDEIPAWLLVKIALVLAAIPLAIAGLKKQNKPLVALAVVIFVYVYGVAESKSVTMQKSAPARMQAEPAAPTTDPAAVTNELPTGEDAPEISSEMSETALKNARQIYNQLCANCHGEDGQKGVNGAPNLANSMQILAERKAVILNGRGQMPGFKGTLTEQEAEEIGAYTQMLGE
jgi:mono/diheme cytochrome c family protein